MEQAKRGCEFTDRREHKYADLGDVRAKTVEEKVARLEHALAYTRQELEYIKKLILANREAQREWEVKQTRPSSSDSSGR
jgi:NADH:ubiquinone oxidoreductase subunit D